MHLLDIPFSILEAILAKDSSFPRKRIGKHVPFVKSEIMDWMKEGDKAKNTLREEQHNARRRNASQNLATKRNSAT